MEQEHPRKTVRETKDRGEGRSLRMEDVRVFIDGRPVVQGVSLEVKPGEVHALMGPNGTGKSTLALALMGHPSYREVEGRALLGGVDLFDLSPDERARAGLFLAMQYPAEIPGVPLGDFLRTAAGALGRNTGSALAFHREVSRLLEEVGLGGSFIDRGLNDGFSGGEKKRSETVQARLLRPAQVIFDEIDSGLDIDALKSVAEAIRALRDEGAGVLLITHYRRILDHVAPDYVHVMSGGRIVRSATGMALAEALEAHGYEALMGREVPA